eukprot:747673-Hanusia_phi.AAC.2
MSHLDCLVAIVDVQNQENAFVRPKNVKKKEEETNRIKNGYRLNRLYTQISKGSNVCRNRTKSIIKCATALSCKEDDFRSAQSGRRVLVQSILPRGNPDKEDLPGQSVRAVNWQWRSRDIGTGAIDVEGPAGRRVQEEEEEEEEEEVMG